MLPPVRRPVRLNNSVTAQAASSIEMEPRLSQSLDANPRSSRDNRISTEPHEESVQELPEEYITLEQLIEASKSVEARELAERLRNQRDKKDHYLVEKILEEVVQNEVKGYLVKWVDYE